MKHPVSVCHLIGSILANKSESFSAIRETALLAEHVRSNHFIYGAEIDVLCYDIGC